MIRAFSFLPVVAQDESGVEFTRIVILGGMKSPKAISGKLTLLFDDLLLCEHFPTSLTVEEPSSQGENMRWRFDSIPLTLFHDQTRFLVEKARVCSFAFVEASTGNVFTSNVVATGFLLAGQNTEVDFEGAGILDGYELSNPKIQ